MYVASISNVFKIVIVAREKIWKNIIKLAVMKDLKYRVDYSYKRAN